VVWYKGADLSRFVILETMIENVKIENIRIYHDDLAYCELEKAVQGLSEHY